MLLSTKGKYGLRAILDIAENTKENKFVSINDVAMRQNISFRYLERIIAKLKKADIVRSERGVNGGYVLSREPKDINMLEVLTVLEDNLDVVECMDNHVYQKCDSKGNCCRTRSLWLDVNKAVKDVLRNKTLEDMLK